MEWRIRNVDIVVNIVQETRGYSSNLPIYPTSSPQTNLYVPISRFSFNSNRLNFSNRFTQSFTSAIPHKDLQISTTMVNMGSFKSTLHRSLSACEAIQTMACWDVICEQFRRVTRTANVLVLLASSSCGDDCRANKSLAACSISSLLV